MKLADELLSDKLCEHLKKKVLPAIQAASDARNVLVHANWSISDEYPDALIRVGPSGEWLVYDESDFRKAIRSIHIASEAIVEFSDKSRQFLKRRKKPR